MTTGTDLAATLDQIEQHDTDYAIRYGLVLKAMHLAHELGYSAGYGFDWESSDADGYRTVAYIELPTGQVSWHMPEHPREWDGHSTEQKYERTREWAEVNRG